MARIIITLASMLLSIQLVSAELRSSVTFSSLSSTEFDIIYTFDKEYECGQYANGELSELQIVAAVQRHIQDALFVDHLSRGSRFGLDQTRRRRNIYAFGNGTDFQGEVQASHLTHLQFDAGSIDLLETLFSDRHSVLAGRQQRDREKPQSV